MGTPVAPPLLPGSRVQVRHVLYTEPEVVLAGREVTVYYNPAETPLNGRSSVFLRGGWNRWNHPMAFGPVQMTAPAAGGQHFSATVRVPADAFKMDFVFSDVAEGDGTYDTRGGLDYHLPVQVRWDGHASVSGMDMLLYLDGHVPVSGWPCSCIWMDMFLSAPVPGVFLA